jgi:SOS-response transcriptional repressor LexA
LCISISLKKKDTQGFKNSLFQKTLKISFLKLLSLNFNIIACYQAIHSCTVITQRFMLVLPRNIGEVLGMLSTELPSKGAWHRSYRSLQTGLFAIRSQGKAGWMRFYAHRVAAGPATDMEELLLHKKKALSFYRADFEAQGIPLYGMRIAAGSPSLADEFIEKYVNFNEYLVPHPLSTFCVRVVGIR